jgi:hypothetical protein
MNMRRELIVNALAERFRELCDERFAGLNSGEFGKPSDFESRIREQFNGTAPQELPTDLSKCLSPSTVSNGWVESDTDCLSFLRHLALGEEIRLTAGRQPPTTRFLQQLISARANPAQRFQLLTTRYACPLNFAGPSEQDIREHLLERLMVQDRGRVENDSITSVESNDLLLRLNLIAIHASRSTDLRFLDALNYYYELIPATWRPHAQHNWLLVSYLALYARALTAWVGRK